MDEKRFEYIKERKEKMLQMRNEANAIQHIWDIKKTFMGNIEDIARLAAGGPVKTDFQRGYVLPARTNAIDVGLDIIEQHDGDMLSKNDLIEYFDEICKYQEKATKGDDRELFMVDCCKNIFKHFPEYRDLIDLPQTLRMFNILSQSQNPENKALLPEIEKDLQAKAWRYFAGNGNVENGVAKVNPTPYSVSCIGELKDYMMTRLHAPEDVIAPKLKDIETSMMSAIYNETLQKRLTPEAQKLVYNTAMKYPNHGSSKRIRENIKFTYGKGGSEHI